MTAAVIGATLLWAIRGFTIPLKKLQEGISELGTGSLEKRLKLTGKNEISAVANEFDKMADRLHATTVSRDELRAEIAVREQAQQEKKELEDLLAQAQKMAGIGYWTYDPVIQMPTWTEEIFRIFGLDPSKGEVSLEDHRLLIHPDDWQIFDIAMMKLLNDGKSYDLFLRSIHKDGSIVHYNTKGFASYGEDGRLKRLYGVCQDVTERKQAEDALRQEKKKAEQILQLAGVMFVGLDTKGTVTLVNRKACEILDYEEDEIIGLNWFDHFIARNTRKSAHQDFQQVMAGDILC